MNLPLKTEQNIRIMHITRNLPPLVGGMERLNWHIANELSKKFQLQIVAPELARCEAPVNANFHGIPLKPLWLFVVKSVISGIKLAKSIRPNIVIAGSGLTAPTAFIVSKLFNVSSIAYVHGLDITVNNIIYRLIWLPFIRRMDKVIANSSYTANLAISMGVPADVITIIPPGVELKNHPTNTEETEGFLSKYDLKDRKILLSVGRLAERKGLRELVKYSLPKIVEEKAQLHHLQEIHRVLKEDGIGYIALPNRWMLVEPHYQLAFLSWLPHRLRTPYLKFRNRGEFYDCEPLEMKQLETLLLKAGLNGKNLCPDAIVETFLIEKPHSRTTAILQKIPRSFLAMFNRAIPTLIYSFKRERK